MNEENNMSNNPFETHGVKYLSPSSINKFAKNPAKWLTNIAGYTDKMYKPAFTFGIAIEQGITQATMTEATIAQSIEYAMETFDDVRKKVMEVNADYDFDMHNKKQLQVANTLQTIIPEYRALGTPIAAQKWVQWECDELPIPIRGILDLEFEDCVRDIKTTGVKPNINTEYDRQLTFYALATEKAPVVDYIYVTAKQSSLISFDIQNVNKHIEDIKRIANKMMRLLSLSSDIEEVCYLSCLEPNLSNENWYDQWGANEIVGAKKLFIK